MSPPIPKDPSRRDKILNLTLASVAAQAGCVTLVVVLAAVFAGLWLDNRYATRPWFTLGLLVVSIPISLGLMFWIVRLAVSKIKPGSGKPQESTSKEEKGLGNDA
ncbi:MAG: AtpZ/AtpI family protein [Chloroflexota bacterium]|jgi:F0F1-type ATP synthase assembly protein I